MKRNDQAIGGAILLFRRSLRSLDHSLRRLAPLLSAATSVNGARKARA